MTDSEGGRLIYYVRLPYHTLTSLHPNLRRIPKPRASSIAARLSPLFLTLVSVLTLSTM